MDQTRLEAINNLLDAEADTELAPELSAVETRLVYITPTLAELLLEYNMKPTIGKPGTNRRLVAHNITDLMKAIEHGDWKFNHQGIAFNEDGDMIDGQHRLIAIARVGKTQPDISVPLLVTVGLPVTANEKIDLVRRRSVGTFLAMQGYASAGHLNTILRLLTHYGSWDFDKVGFEGPHWSRIISLDEAHKALDDYPFAKDAVNIGSQLRKFIAVSAAGAAWTLTRTKYPEAMNMEFIHGIKSGANLDDKDPRLAFIRWATNQKATGKQVIPAVHLAAYIKAFTAFRLGEPMALLNVRPSAEKFPRA